MVDRRFEKYIGLPFARDGHGPDAFNCWGLVCRVLEDQCGIVINRYTGIKAGNVYRLGEAMRQEIKSGDWAQVEFGQQKQFDVATLVGDYIDRHKELKVGEIHIGVFLSDRAVLHTENETDSCFQLITNNVFRQKVRRIFRHKVLQ